MTFSVQIAAVRSQKVTHLFTFLRATLRLAPIGVDDGDTGDFVGHDEGDDVQAGCGGVSGGAARNL